LVALEVKVHNSEGSDQAVPESNLEIHTSWSLFFKANTEFDLVVQEPLFKDLTNGEGWGKDSTFSVVFVFFPGFNKTQSGLRAHS
jgi:hypothetical protein